MKDPSKLTEKEMREIIEEVFAKEPVSKVVLYKGCPHGNGAQKPFDFDNGYTCEKCKERDAKELDEHIKDHLIENHYIKEEE